MGELRTRKRGKKWEYSFEGARINGKRQPISKSGFATKAEALAAGIQAKAEYDNCGRIFTPSELSVADYLDYWLENYVKKNCSYNTYNDYESKIRLHIKPSLGHYRLSSLEPDIIQKWIDDKKLTGLSKSMTKNILICLSGALRYAVIPCKYIKDNPSIYVKAPKMETDRTRLKHTEYICRGKDFEAIIDRFPEGSNFYLPIMVGYCLGTRIGETYGIDLLEDPDFITGYINIEHQLKKENKNWFYRPPKYESHRSIKMGNTLPQILKREITRRKRLMMNYGEYFMKTYKLPDNSIVQFRADISVPYKEIMPLSVKENGELLTPESFKYCARVIHHELNNPLFHSHCLRHTHGTILAENGAFPKTVMERLGHKDVKVTMEKYIFNTEKMQDDAMIIFEKNAW